MSSVSLKAQFLCRMSLIFEVKRKVSENKIKVETIIQKLITPPLTPSAANFKYVETPLIMNFLHSLKKSVFLP